jgi:DNA invertase Pin-like site-specific DNA recombinase
MTTSDREAFIPIDRRDPASVRAVILARSSDLSARAEDMRGQVEQCRDFITRMSWTLAFDAYSFTEAATGMRHVRRPVLDEVLRLAAAGEIDVVVVREPERIARSEGRRWQAIQTAADFGVEFRFANRPPDGKLPQDKQQKAFGALQSYFAEAEAERIAERLRPEKLRRLVDGLPHGGRGGPSFGYIPGERREGKHGGPMGLLSWRIDDGPTGTAQVVRWMFDEVDRSEESDVSVRGLSKELNRRGVPSPTGVNPWTPRAVKIILSNPKYCGLGRNARWQSEHVETRDATTHEVNETTVVHDRMADPAAWETETYAVSAQAIPPIITVEQWERVQAKLRRSSTANRSRPRRSDAEAQSTLLDGGLIRCGECNRVMTRYWTTVGRTPYYRCSDAPNHPPFEIHAHKADNYVLNRVADTLSDPEQVLALADSAEAQMAEASVEARLSVAALAAYQAQVAQITAQQDELVKALDALSHVPGMQAQMAEVRSRLAQLDHDLTQAHADHANAQPRHALAAERAALLRALFTQRESIISFALGEEQIAEGEPWLHIGRVMRLDQAAALLRMSEADVRATGVPVEEDKVDGVIEPQILTTFVVRLLLRRMPREALRALLRNLKVVALVRRGRSREEYRALGAMPLSERVQVEVMGSLRGREHNMIIFFSALQAIPQEIYESGRLDGPSQVGVALRLKVPLIRPALVLGLLFSLIGTLQLFNEPQILSRLSGSINSHFTPNIFAYHIAFVQTNYYYGGALAIILGLLTFAFSYGFLRLTRGQSGG